jgi:hypothetical protein
MAAHNPARNREEVRRPITWPKAAIARHAKPLSCDVELQAIGRQHCDNVEMLDSARSCARSDSRASAHKGCPTLTLRVFRSSSSLLLLNRRVCLVSTRENVV